MNRQHNIVICIPNYNGAKELASMNVRSKYDIVVIDNASTDNSVEICREKGWKVIENVNTVDRVDNWIRCLEFFKNSDYEWMKWLFVGDELAENFDNIVDKNIEKYYDPSVIVFSYLINGKNTVSTWRCSLESGKYTIKEISNELIKGNNIFGSPIGILVSKAAISSSKNIEVNNLSWAADKLIGYYLAKTGYTVVSDDVIGEFNILTRKHFQKLSNSLEALLEEIEVLRIIVNDQKSNGRTFEWKNTAVYHYLFRAVSTYYGNKPLGKLIRKAVISKSNRKKDKILK